MFAHLNRYGTFAVAAGKPMDNTFLIHSAFILMENTGFFTEACHLWRMKPQNTRTYALFQEHFYVAHRDLSKITASEGYHSDNTVKEAALYAAFKNLAAEFLAFKAEVSKKNTKSVPNAPPKAKLATDKTWHIACPWLHVEPTVQEFYLQVARNRTCVRSDGRQPAGRHSDHLTAAPSKVARSANLHLHHLLPKMPAQLNFFHH
jgi:hypothetical protein